MTKVQPLPHSYQVTHSDLVKFGIDGTQKAKSIPYKNSILSETPPILFSYQLPQILSALTPKNKIKIIRNISDEDYELDVDRETGFIVKERKGFKHISKFDPSSLPDEKPSVRLQQVAYWDRHNNYVGPK